MKKINRSQEGDHFDSSGHMFSFEKNALQGEKKNYQGISGSFSEWILRESCLFKAGTRFGSWKTWLAKLEKLWGQWTDLYDAANQIYDL